MSCEQVFKTDASSDAHAFVRVRDRSAVARCGVSIAVERAIFGSFSDRCVQCFPETKPSYDAEERRKYKLVDFKTGKIEP